MSSPAVLAERARAGGRLGIDTEFMAEGRYQALLCLVQVAVPTGEGDAVEVAVLDPLDGTGFDSDPLAEVLADPAIEIVMHAGRQDVAILRRAWKTDVTNIFDTQIAAGFGGLRAQMGYGDMLNDVLDIKVAKTASFTRWDKRPLTARAGRLRALATSSTCSSSRPRSRSASTARAGSSGRARSAASSSR